MASKSLVLGVIFLFLLLFVAVAYFISRDSDKDVVVNDEPMREIYLDIKDSQTNNYVKSNYSIYLNNSQYSSGQTSGQSLERINIPLNSTVVKIYVFNDEYYSELRSLESTTASIRTSKLSPLKISHSGNLINENNLIKYFIESGSDVRELSFCVAWSQNILEINSYQFQDIKNFESDETLPPTFLNNRIDKCYIARKNLKAGEQRILELYYSLYGSISERDYIKIYFIDSDLDSNGKYVFEIDGKDVGLNTSEYEVIKQ